MRIPILIFAAVFVALLLALSQAHAQSVPTWAENHSYCTTCAEEDNISIPLFAEAIIQYDIVATHPTYSFAVDNCDADFSGCTRRFRQTPAQGDTCTEPPLYDDGRLVVIGCTVDDWWRPEAMTIQVGSESSQFHYLVLNHKIEGVESWPQFLVLYADGYLRLKPHQQEGQGDNCFGSSIIVGPVADYDQTRPYADIATITVQPATNTMDIAYRSGGSARMWFDVDRSSATATVNVSYPASATQPFAALRSMWIEDGNADADRIENPDGVHHIKQDWTELDGPWWRIFRSTLSVHNTSAPDLRVSVVNTTSPVTMAEMRAQLNADGSATVSWSTASEIDLAGFNVLRSVSAESNPTHLNTGLIAATAALTGGDSYDFVDATAGVGDDSAEYWVEAVDLDGSSTVHGPVALEIEQPTSAALTALSGGPNWALPMLLAGGLLLLVAATVAVRHARVSLE